VCNPCLRIDVDTFQTGEIDQDSAIAGAQTRDAVTTGTHGHNQSVLPGEIDCRRDVRRTGAPRDDGRSLRVHHVEHAPGLVVLGIFRQDHLACEPRA
jgi:hypothetical protein